MRKIKAYADFVGIADVLDPVSMKNCPKWSEYAVLNIAKIENQRVDFARQMRSPEQFMHWNKAIVME
jgi:hypothetical protein